MPFTLSHEDIANLERATLDAVAPPFVQAIDGWLLPFDNSTIGRAKSAVPLRQNDLDALQIAHIEALYAARGLQTAFRVADVVGLSSIHGMRTALNRRGRGLAARVLAGLADTATQQGLENVFLQVEEGNRSALSLYQRARFTTAWRYHYWHHTGADIA